MEYAVATNIDNCNLAMRAKKFISEQQWIFAKTMANIPHFYCLLSRTPNKDEFLWFVKYMDANSVDGVFYGKKYKYFFLDGWKYWVMDSTPENCDLINREEQRQ